MVTKDTSLGRVRVLLSLSFDSWFFCCKFLVSVKLAEVSVMDLKNKQTKNLSVTEARNLQSPLPKHVPGDLNLSLNTQDIKDKFQQWENDPLKFGIIIRDIGRDT